MREGRHRKDGWTDGQQGNGVENSNLKGGLYLLATAETPLGLLVLR